MTNLEVFKIFKQRYPDAEVSDYRQMEDMYLPKGQAGIVIWLKNGDAIMYFPWETKEKREG